MGVAASGRWDTALAIMRTRERCAWRYVSKALVLYGFLALLAQVLERF